MDSPSSSIPRESTTPIDDNETRKMIASILATRNDPPKTFYNAFLCSANLFTESGMK